MGVIKVRQSGPGSIQDGGAGGGSDHSLTCVVSEPLADECADCVGSPPLGRFSGHTGTGILEQ